MQQKRQNQRPDLDDQLRIENEIIKMKLMLEFGAQFASGQGTARMEPALEHAFLKHVLAMEEAHKNGNSLTIFEKLGCPTDIPAPEDLTEEDLPAALRQLQKKLAEHGIEVKAIEKDIPPEQLYRFLARELMDVKVADTPRVHCFLFEGYPALEENRLEHIALQECLQSILSGKAPRGEISENSPLRLNGFEHHNRETVQQRMTRFRAHYEEIIGIRNKIDRSILENGSCTVFGSHETALCTQNKCEIVRGEWFVAFQRQADEEWSILEIDIDGLSI